MIRGVNIYKKINYSFYITLYIVGLIFGIVFTKNYQFNINKQSFSIMNILSLFSITFFMYFVLIMTKNTFIIHFELLICVYFRGFSLGVFINAIINYSFVWCLCVIIVEIICSSYLFCLIINDVYNFKKTETNKLITLYIIIILLYSIILELVGGKFG